MKQDFTAVMKVVEEQYKALRASGTFPCANPPASLEGKKGIYLMSDADAVLYVGRTNNLRRRLQNHIRRSHNTATFAFVLARRKTGRKATYQTKGSRADLLKNDPEFASAFDDARKWIGKMNVQIVVENNPTHQALLEIYAAYVSDAKYNDFDNH